MKIRVSQFIPSYKYYVSVSNEILDNYHLDFSLRSTENFSVVVRSEVLKVSSGFNSKELKLGL